MFTTCEVIETKMAFKKNQKDDKGNTLPIGSILVRHNANSVAGQVKNVYARPATFNRRIPFIGEHVIVAQVPLHDKSANTLVSSGYIYYSPVNVTDDLALHQFPKLWDRSNHYDSKAPTIKSDRKEIGYNYVKAGDLKLTRNIQPFEGDDIIESRFGSSIRMSSSIEKSKSTYDKTPDWKGKSNGDPITILRVKKPAGVGTRNSSSDVISKLFSNEYEIEDINKDDSSIWMTSTQSIPTLKVGFKKHLEGKTAGTWSKGSQIILNADRVLINSKSDKTFIFSAKESVLGAPKVLLQSDKYKVYLDDLMEYIKDMTTILKDWASGTKFFTTSAGPTSVATNLADVIKLQTVTFNTKFKKP